MYWAPGAAHGPHHIFKEWADKDKGKFDDGWDAMRPRVFKRQQEMGWIPATAELIPRPDSMAAWDSIPDVERPFQRRLMEVYAGFTEHVDVQVGKLIDELDRLGLRDNTIIFLHLGRQRRQRRRPDGQHQRTAGPEPDPQHHRATAGGLKTLGGLDALGTAKTENMYHAGWAWAGNTPLKYTKLIASHFGAPATPWSSPGPRASSRTRPPGRSSTTSTTSPPPSMKSSASSRPRKWTGSSRIPWMASAWPILLSTPRPPARKKTHYFDNNGSRGIYHDGWYACTFGPLTPWLTTSPGLAAWDANKDVWELYNFKSDYSQAEDPAAKEPQRLANLKELFLEEAKKNKAFPIGAGIWLRLHPEDRIKSPYTSWVFDATTTRMPEFTAPGLGRENNASYRR